ncbi:MAG: hypothetical protein CMQ05_18015 [Gammaproteobacteria bacterium]|nr:hypothetical protein [Gammaproteobacteria bacterium]
MQYQFTEHGVLYTLEWQSAGGEVLREVTTLWEQQGVLPLGTKASDRARELMMTARAEEGQLLGLST